MKLPRFSKPHIKITTLTKYLALAGVVVAVLLLTVAVVHEYRVKQTTLTQKHQAELQAAEQKGYAEGSKEVTILRTKTELWKLECQKGQNAYKLLSTAQKRLIKQDQVPNCTQAVLQP